MTETYRVSGTIVPHHLKPLCLDGFSLFDRALDLGSKVIVPGTSLWFMASHIAYTTQKSIIGTFGIGSKLVGKLGLSHSRSGCNITRVYFC